MQRNGFWSAGRTRLWLRRGVALALCASVLAALCGIGGFAALAMRLQFASALLRGIGECSAGALAIAGNIALLTLLFGRFYCSLVCPLGTLQEGIAVLNLRKRPCAPPPNWRILRYGIAGTAFGLIACGSSWGLALLDPYTNFGRIFGAFLRGGFLPLLILIALVFWKRRIFCTALCPVGTLLGLCAKHSLLRLRINADCILCGKCVNHCPAGCIDLKDKSIDQERCLRCLACIAVCPRNAIGFSRNQKSLPVELDRSRRRFLRNGAVLLAGIAGGAVLAKLSVSRMLRFRPRTGILPPGAGSLERFAEKCTGCQLCVRNCPEKIIVPTPGGTGPVSLDYSRGSCRFDCNHCTEVCPFGALSPLPPARKQRTQLAVAKLDPQLCRVYQGEEESCGKCAAACPTGAARLRKTGAPYPIKANLCIGCGACFHACPAIPKAIRMEETTEQTLLPSAPNRS